MSGRALPGNRSKLAKTRFENRKAEKARRALEAARNKPFKECAEACFNDHSPAWKSAVHRQDWLSTLQRYAFSEFGELPVAQIDAGLVLRVLKPLWLTKTKTAKMLRQRIEAGFELGYGPRLPGWREPSPAEGQSGAHAA